MRNYTRCKIQANIKSPDREAWKNRNGDNKVTDRNKEGEGRSPDPSAAVVPALPGAFQVQHGMIPPPGTPNHPSRTAELKHCPQKWLEFIIPQSKIFQQENEFLNQAASHHNQFSNHEKGVNFATFLTPNEVKEKLLHRRVRMHTFQGLLTWLRPNQDGFFARHIV